MATVPDPTYDVLAAPHHGGLKANTPRFAAWASPSVVVVSCGERVNAAALDRIYPEADLFLTSQHGALTLSFDADGAVRIVGAAHDAVPSSGR